MLSTEKDAPLSNRKRSPILKVNLSQLRFDNEYEDYKTSWLELKQLSFLWYTCEFQTCVLTVKSFQCSGQDSQRNLVVYF